MERLKSTEVCGLCTDATVNLKETKAHVWLLVNLHTYSVHILSLLSVSWAFCCQFLGSRNCRQSCSLHKAKMNSQSSHNFPEATLLLTLTLSQDLTSQSQSCWLPGSTASGPQNALRIVCAKGVSAGSCQPVPPDTCCESVAAGFWRWRSPKK